MNGPATNGIAIGIYRESGVWRGARAINQQQLFTHMSVSSEQRQDEDDGVDEGGERADEERDPHLGRGHSRPSIGLRCGQLSEPLSGAMVTIGCPLMPVSWGSEDCDGSLARLSDHPGCRRTGIALLMSTSSNDGCDERDWMMVGSARVTHSLS